MTTKVTVLQLGGLKLHFVKVKSHAGIVGNECADAIAKHQAIQDNDTPTDITFPCANLKAILFMTPRGLPLRKLPALTQMLLDAGTPLP